MKLDDIRISKTIIERYTAKLLDALESDVAIVGGGPSGLAAAYYLAKEGHKVTLFERKLSIGGGMWGGGIMFNEIVVQEGGKKILDEFGIRTKSAGDGYYSADSVEATSTLCSAAVKAGTGMFNLMSVEDVKMDEEKVTGLVIIWTSIEMASLHVDPVTMRSKFVVDATGHAAEIAHILQDKGGHRLNTPTGRIMGEKHMCAEVAETLTVENTKEYFPNVYGSGMCCNAVYGGPRMGPVFGGMLMSGKKAAEMIHERL